jgi:hypothetical protein
MSQANSELRVLAHLARESLVGFSHARQSFRHSNAKDAKTGGMNSFAGTQKTHNWMARHAA